MERKLKPRFATIIPKFNCLKYSQNVFHGSILNSKNKNYLTMDILVIITIIIVISNASRDKIVLWGSAGEGVGGGGGEATRCEWRDIVKFYL